MDNVCHCGKIHKSSVETVVCEKGAAEKLPQFVKQYNSKKAFVVADINTNNAAGEKVCEILKKKTI